MSTANLRSRIVSGHHCRSTNNGQCAIGTGGQFGVGGNSVPK